MIGIVLSGGQSTRMGQDKGLMMTEGKPWAKIAFEKLRAVGVTALVSVNKQQMQKYLQYFDGEELIVDRDLDIQGPLNGVLSAHLLHPDHDLMVLACDMINLQSFLLEELAREYKHHQPEAIAFKAESVEPLCAIYSSRGLKKIKMQHTAGFLKNHGLKIALEILDTNYLYVSKENQQFFKSINRAEDFR